MASNKLKIYNKYEVYPLNSYLVVKTTITLQFKFCLMFEPDMPDEIKMT